MKSTMVLTSDSWGRPVWVDMGWRACDERLVAVAAEIEHGVGDATPSCPTCVEHKEELTQAMARN